MSRVTEKFLDLLSQSEWSSWSMPTKKIDINEQMAIVPDTEHGPMLEISASNGQGLVLYQRCLNLAAVDDEIGKLIKMRDHMAQMKGDR
jgi:hypothetical protein